MHQTIDRRRGGHRVLKNLLPLRERKIARQHHTASLVAVGQKRKQYIHLFAALLDVADVVDDEGGDPPQPLEQTCRLQLALGHQKLLPQQAEAREQHPSASVNQLLSDGT